jgi:hypothetical protein
MDDIARQDRMKKLVAAGRLATDVKNIQANDQKRSRPKAVKAARYKRKGI